MGQEADKTDLSSVVPVGSIGNTYWILQDPIIVLLDWFYPTWSVILP